MTISGYQIRSVVKTYMKNMKVRAGLIEGNPENNSGDSELNISGDGIKKMMYERIGEQMTEQLKKNNREER